MSILNGLKESLKLDQVTTGVTSKLNSAREYIQEKQQVVADSGTFRSLKEKVGNFTPPGQLGSYFGHGAGSKSGPEAGGVKQSPIDIRIAECKYDEALSETSFQFSYNPRDCATLLNPGQTWRVSATPSCSSTFKADFLPNEEFKFQQLHAHWSTESHNGSEHLLSGLGYAAEVHIVHYNTKYGTLEEAVKHDDGLLVLGILLDEGVHNDGLESLVRLMDKVSYKDEQISLPNGFDIRSLLPAIKDFWTYEGSLTTPPYCESVIWLVFRGTISVSRAQLDKMRNLHTVGVEDCERNPQKMTCNVRPPQPLNDRIVRSSFLSPKQQ